MFALALSVLTCLLTMTSAGKSCQLLDWEVTYTSRERYVPDDFSDVCLERCRADFGDRCLRTDVWYGNEHDMQCDAFVDDEGFKTQSFISVKLCRPQLPRCNSKSCNPCFPCREGTLKNGPCQHIVLRLRFGTRTILRESSVAACRQACWNHPDCVWVVQANDQCTINTLADSDDYIGDTVMTIQDHTCLPPVPVPTDYPDL